MSTSPIPNEWLVHGIVLLDHMPPLESFFKEARTRIPPLDSRPEWVAMGKPRPCSYGPLEAGEWRWQLVLDPQGLPPGTRDIVQQCVLSEKTEAAIESHQAAVFVFLTGAPKDAQRLGPLGALSTVMWAWMDAGGTACIFPSGRRGWHRDELQELEPPLLPPEAAVEKFMLFEMSDGVARTWGLGQAGLPDLAVELTDDADMPRRVEIFFSSLVPHLLEGGPLPPPEETIVLGDDEWRLTAQGEGLLYFEQVGGAHV